MGVTQSVGNLVEWFDRSAIAFRGRAAIEDSFGSRIEYSDLANVSRDVKGALERVGVREGDRIGVFMKKSIDTAIAFQGILRSRCSYVPVDPRAPAGRAAYMLNDCMARAVIVDEDFAPVLEAELRKTGRSLGVLVVPPKAKNGHSWRIESISVSKEPPAQREIVRDNNMAFLLYTSGSTGTPKAVIVTHENVIDFIDWSSKQFHLSEHDRFATHSPLHFSLPVFQLYAAWKHGGSVVLIDEETARVPELILSFLERSGITIWFSTPTILSLVAHSGRLSSIEPKSVRLVMFGGEAFPMRNLRSLRAQLPHPRFVNILGSTETHMIASYDVPQDISVSRTAPVPVGKIGDRFRARVLDDNGKDCRAGCDGELVLSGPGVTPGYWQVSEESSRSFFEDCSGERWYRTGDILRIDDEGNFEYRGRRDRMVKKYGNRVELAEIEACLHAFSKVKEAAVIAMPDEEEGVKIQACVVPDKDGVPTILELRAHCVKVIPQYMIPDGFTFYDSLPRTSTGKIDYLKLKKSAIDARLVDAKRAMSS